jgi:hypothetical protein
LVTIPAGQTSYEVIIEVYGDRDFESDETFFVNLSSPVNADISDGQAVGTIVNDDRNGRMIVDGRWGQNETGQQVLTATDLASLLSVAEARWIEAGGATASQLDELDVDIRLTRFDGAVLGATVIPPGESAFDHLDRAMVDKMTRIPYPLDSDAADLQMPVAVTRNPAGTLPPFKEGRNEQDAGNLVTGFSDKLSLDLAMEEGLQDEIEQSVVRDLLKR